jgi:putative oxidoreductase
VLSGRFTALGLTLLAPVIVNILCFHIFLNHEGWQLASVVAALELFLLWRNRAAFAGLLKP